MIDVLSCKLSISQPVVLALSVALIIGCAPSHRLVPRQPAPVSAARPVSLPNPDSTSVGVGEINIVATDTGWKLTILENGGGHIDRDTGPLPRDVSFPAGTFDFEKLQPKLLVEIALTDQSWRSAYWVWCATKHGSSANGLLVRGKFALPLFNKAYGASRGDRMFSWFEKSWKELPPR